VSGGTIGNPGETERRLAAAIKRRAAAVEVVPDALVFARAGARMMSELVE
jgi:hypothetical protein